ncbi:MAG TPA: hypothetical protein VFK42_13460 [Acidimicrobiales bacterium]|nr:hypothetical protein [Acidimicrobiales bacterium]
MDLNKLTQGEKVIAGSGVALLIFSFFPWFGLGGGSHNGWDNFLSALAILIGVVMVAQIAIARFTETKLPDVPIGWGMLHMILGGVAAVFVLLQLLVGDKVSALGFSVDLDRKFGVFLGLLAALGLAGGGYLKWQEQLHETGGEPLT